MTLRKKNTSRNKGFHFYLTMMNSVMTGSIKNPFQRPKFGDNLKKCNVLMNLKILYKIKKKQRNERRKGKRGCLSSGELHKKKCDVFF